MARRSGGTHKGVEDKRRSLPIYQHYTLSPGKTKSHHPEAKCNHCLKEFVCGSKQRLIRHLRKCNSISNPEQIIAETLNTLARNSATGQLNHSILEASNLLPSQIPHLHHHQHNHHHHQQNQANNINLPQQQHLQHHQLINQQQINNDPSPSSASSITTVNSNTINNGSNHHKSGSSSCDNNGLPIACSSNGSQSQQRTSMNMVGGSSAAVVVNTTPLGKRCQRRGRKPANQSLASASPSIHVTTGLDGKTHFTPASQLPSTISGTIASPLQIAPLQNGQAVGYTYHQANVSSAALASGSHHLSTNSGHLGCATTNHSSIFKLNSEPIDKAYLKLVLTRNLPLSLCDTKEFQMWVKTFANDYKPPSSNDLIMQNLKSEAQAAKQRISNILVKAPKKTINLELHYWPNEIRGHLWYAVIANVDYKRFLISVRNITPQRFLDNSTHPNHQQLNNLQHHNHNNSSSENNNNNSTTAATTTNNNYSNNHNQTSDSGLHDRKLAGFIDECIKRVGSDRINSLVSKVDTFPNEARKSLYTTHPSIVTYYCWWHFTNSLCSDIVEHSETFQRILRNSNRLINFVKERPQISLSLENFSPFAGVAGSNCPKKDDPRWYSHLVCYLLEYIKNNNEAIIRALEAYSNSSTTQSHLSSDSNNNNNNNNSSSESGANSQVASVIRLQEANNAPSTHQTLLSQEEANLNEINSIILSSEYWTNLNLALVYLKPFHNIVALTSTPVSSQHNGNGNTNNAITATALTTANSSTTVSNNTSSNSEETPVQQSTISISPIASSNLLLSDYMSWFLNYGKILFDNWFKAPDSYKHQLISCYLARFSSSLQEFKLLIAAYLLNPRHRCAYMTERAKNVAIEEILNIASEFMPDESDGHTILDQWKLYLVREEPYDMVYEENRSTPLDWWMSLPCAESIRRVALRILRLKAFTLPRSETLFSQLYYYENESRSRLGQESFEDLAVLRYFYDFEDKVGHSAPNPIPLHIHTASTNAINNGLSIVSSNGYAIDRAQAGQVHSQQHQSNCLPTGSLDDFSGTNGQVNDSMSMNVGSGQNYSDSFSDVVVESYMNHNANVPMMSQANMNSGSGLSLEDIPGYKLFAQFVDYNESGVQVAEEPIEKKKRKWTAQEILSKCQSNHYSNNNISGNEIASK